MYKKLAFPHLPDRPWIYANAVVTLDGKAAVCVPGNLYWPLGSRTDFETLMTLRAHADLLVHGRKTAMVYRALGRLEHPDFLARRTSLKKEPALPYAVFSSHHASSLVPFLSSKQVPTYLASQHRALPMPLKGVTTLIPCGKKPSEMVRRFVEWSGKQGHKQILLEGGPTLLQSFVDAGFLDELFLTITPKLVGGAPHITKTLLDEGLFSPEGVRRAHLVSCASVGDEVFLRYRFTSV